MKSCLLYFSKHHNNTKKLAEAIQKKLKIDIFSVTEDTIILDNYDTVVLASGIYMGNFGKEMIAFIENNASVLQSKNNILLYTCGSGSASYGKKLQQRLQQLGIATLGFWRCKGYDTYGFFKFLGGIGKGHPNEKDVISAVQFLDTIFQKQVIDL